MKEVLLIEIENMEGICWLWKWGFEFFKILGIYVKKGFKVGVVDLGINDI